MNFSPIVKNREFIKMLTPALRYKQGSDFAAWQAEARAKLAELLGIHLIAPVDSKFEVVSSSKTKEYSEYVIKIQTEADYYLTATLRAPTCECVKVPLVVFPCGHSEDMVALFENGAVCDAVKRGYAALVVEQRSFDNCFAIPNVIPEETTTRTTWNACYRSSMRAVMLGRTTMGERVWDLMRAIDAVLENYDFIDGGKVTLVGTSGGATIAYYTACVDERIAAVVASSGISSYEKSIIARNHCVCNYIPYIVNYFEMGDLAGLIAPRKLVIIAPKNDEWFPLDGAVDAYDLAKSAYTGSSAPDAVKLYTPDDDHSFYADIVWNELT